MLLTVLGCSGSAPGPRSPASGYLLQADGFRLVIELGNGTLAELQAVCDPFTVDALLLSHLHPDHCADFSSLTVLRRYHTAPSRDPRANRLPVHAPREAPSRFVAAYSPDAADRATEEQSDIYDFHELGDGTIHIGPFEVTSILAAHPCEAYSFRIVHDGRSLVYTGDTGVSPALDDLSVGADVVLAEASWTHSVDRPTGMHMSGTEAGRLAKTAGARRLLITHILPWTDETVVLAEARAEIGDAAELVVQGGTYEI